MTSVSKTKSWGVCLKCEHMNKQISYSYGWVDLIGLLKLKLVLYLTNGNNI
jgi:hypothetical protein